MKMLNAARTITALSLLSIVTAAAQMPPVRVACIGNSITIGYGLPDPNSAYPQQLGRLLGKGCSEKVMTSGIIRNFSASKSRLTGAGPVTLYWQTTNGTGVTLDGRKVSQSDSLVVHPERTSIYTLITSGTVSDTSMIKVEVAKDR